MRSFKTEGIVIKRKNVGEADRIVTVFTKRFGKIRISAKGVRRISSKRSAHVELLNLAHLTLYKGNGFPILTEAEVIEDFSLIKDNLTKVGFAYHICELVDGLCAENQESRRVFELLRSVLSRLSKEEDIAPIIHEFEIELLSTLGFFPRYQPIHNFDTHSFIERILERKLKSKRVVSAFS